MPCARLFVSAVLAVFLAGPLFAQPKEAKASSPGDLAADQFLKLRNNREAKATPERLQQVMKAGMDFIVAYPAHSRTNGIITSLAGFGSTMPDKSQAALRSWWTAQLNYEVVNRRPGASDDLRAALAALEAANAGVETREQFSREKLTRFREKIDALAGMPGGARFLPAQEKEFLEILKITNPAAAEAHARRLAGHADRRVAAMAKDELNLMEVRAQPYALQFTALDGRAVDVTTLRRRAVALYFWSVGNEDSLKELETLKGLQGTYRAQLEIVTINLDAEADRARVLQAVKDRRIRWPVHFDGRGRDNEAWMKLNVRTAPALVLFDPAGMLVHASLRVNRLEAEIKRMFRIK